jgi:hypothetical protein
MAYEWVNDLTDVGSSALEYLNDNEWAANALSGAAGAGLNYLVQKDQQKYQRREQQRAWDRQDTLAKPGTVNPDRYDWSDLANGSMTNGGLISSARK